MLFKLAYRNIARSKGYFLAYAISLAVFAVLVYSTAIIEISLGQFFMDSGTGLQGINLASLFYWIKIITYITVLIFSIYISNFFLKRRLKEVALYKMFGLSRFKIFQLFIIENTVIISLAFGLSIIFGLFFSRLILMLTVQLFGIDLSSFPMTLPPQAIVAILITLGIVWIAISILPLKIIAKSSISTLFLKKGEQVKPLKFPFISFILFIITTGILVYAIFFIPKESMDIMIRFLVVYILAILVAFFLYKGGISFILMFLKKRGVQFKSPVFLLTVNHFIASIRSTYRLLTFVTVFTATIAVFIVTVFGALNLVKSDTAVMFPLNKISILSTSQESAQHFTKFVDENLGADSFQTIPMMLQTAGEGEGARATYFMTPEQFERYATVTNVDITLKEAVLDKITTQKLPLNLSDIVLDGEERSIVSYLTYEDYAVLDEISSTRFINPTITFQEPPVIENDTLKPVYLHLSTKGFTEKDMFQTIQLFSSPFMNDIASLSNEYGIYRMTYTDVLGIASVNFIYSLFQLVLFIVVLGIIIALIMSLFFRTLEIVENNIEEYMIARSLGFTNRQTFLSILVESAFTQLLPFYMGISVGLVIYQGLFQFFLNNGSSNGGSAPIETVFDLLMEPTTMVLFIGFFVAIHLLYAILLVNVYSRIKNQKMIKE